MTHDFMEKVAIVTGAGQGIGFEIAARLCAAGGKVVLNDVEGGLAEKAAATLNDSAARGEAAGLPAGAESVTAVGPRAVAVPGDASDPAVIDLLVQTAVTRFGRLDIAIPNAGVTLFGPFVDYPLASFNALVKVNLAGTFFLAQAAARQMIAQGSGGSLLFMSSVTGHQAHRDLTAYGMSKAAIEMLARSLVIELSPHRINVNAVAPGATLTERTLDTAGYASRWAEITPMGRAATTTDIAETVLFLVSAVARHITGQCLVVDGGWTSVSPEP